MLCATCSIAAITVPKVLDVINLALFIKNIPF